MKTEGLNFLEAVAALQAGECKGIKRRMWNADSVLVVVGLEKIEFRCGTTYVPYLIDFQNDWVLVNPIPKTERREVKRWYCPICAGTFMNNHSAACACNRKVSELVELTGHYDAPIPRKVKRMVEIGSCTNFQIVFNKTIHLPPGTKIFAELEESGDHS